MADDGGIAGWGRTCVSWMCACARAVRHGSARPGRFTRVGGWVHPVRACDLQGPCLALVQTVLVKLCAHDFGGALPVLCSVQARVCSCVLAPWLSRGRF